MNTLLFVAQVFALLSLLALTWLVIRAFRKHALWGVAVLLLSPFSALFFGIKYWKDEKKPFLTYMTSFGTAAGLALYVFTAWGGWEVARMAYVVHQGIEKERLSQQDAFDFMNANLQFIENASPDEQERKKLQVIREFMDQHASNMTEVDRTKLHNDVVALMEDQALDEPQRQELDYMRKQLAPVQADNAALTSIENEAATSAGTRRTLSKRPSTLKVNYRADYREIDIADASRFIGKSFKVTRRNSEERQCKLIGSSPGKLLFEQRGRGGTFTFAYKHGDIEKLKLLASVDFPESQTQITMK